MALSCAQRPRPVMYGAYYPYLYGRSHPRYHHFQYDRFNVQSTAGVEGYAGPAAGSAPASPPTRLRAKEEDLSAHSAHSADGGGSSESDGECAGSSHGTGTTAAGRAQYVSANCVVFTHYSGDAAANVDEHFARALAPEKHKESVPMVSRNLPASFFNASATNACSGGVELYEYDPWAQYGYGNTGVSAQYPYSPLLLPRSVHPQYKAVEWQHAHLESPHAHAAHAHAAHACAPYSYPPVHGLEAQVQDSSKDLYWF